MVSMREIKFRGWDATGQKGWVFGDLVHNKKVTRTGLEDRVMVGGYEVVPESVGLISGLKDYNGKDIYLGDIVKWSKNGKKHLVIFRAGMFYASVEEFNEGIHGGFPLWYLCEKEQQCCIVGNIYENKN